MPFTYLFKIDNQILKYRIEFTREGNVAYETLDWDGKEIFSHTLTNARYFLEEDRLYQGLDPRIPFLRSLFFNDKFAGIDVFSHWKSYLENSVYINPSRDLFKVIGFRDKNAAKNSLETYLEEFGTEEINSFLQETKIGFEIEYHKESNFMPNLIPISSRLFTKRGQLPNIPFIMESYGSQLLLTMLPAYLSVIKNGGMLIIDEFSSGFHNELEELLVRYFYQHSHRSQLFFVSHSTNLLSTSISRPDQVYSVDFDGCGSYLTKFTSHPMRESQNMEKLYLAGAFGGLPQYGN